MMQYMANLKTKLPPHCQVKKRKNYCDVYFMPHPKDRPDKWPATIHLGRTGKTPAEEIIKRANETYGDYEAFRFRHETGIDIRIKEGSFPDIIKKYKDSVFWTSLTDRTKSDYNIFLNKINEWSFRAGHPHISKLTTKSLYAWIIENWRDAYRRQKYARTVLVILYQMAIREGYVETNLAENIKLKAVKRAEKKKIHIWSQKDIDAFVEEADKRGLHSVGSIVLTGIETAQRQADVIKMRHSVDYMDGKLIYIQQKTGKKVKFNATKKLTSRYKEFHSLSQMFLFINENTKRPWQYRSLAQKIREICDCIGLEGYVYAHLRHSQVYYLYENELNKNIISAMTGHSMKTVDSMLDRHYLEIRNEELANRGVAKIDRVRQKVRQTSQTK
ncbi:hypothetical protein DESC_190049 [Desulfosarcina cetonica]|nr:hypothetical protein DESC_190049 [Desulfosarcina cetonica]